MDLLLLAFIQGDGNLIVNQKQISAILLAVAMGFGLGALVVSWLNTTPNVEQYAAQPHQMEGKGANLARISGNTKGEFDGSNQPMPKTYDVTNNATSKVQIISTTESEISHPDTPRAEAITPTAHELEYVTQIVDGIRSHNMPAYSNLPSLMSSPEMAALSPAARSKIMEEVSRMLENGEIDQATFFTKQ